MIETAEADYSSYFFSPSVRLGYQLDNPSGATWTPSASFRLVYGQLDGYEENGSDQDLSMDEQTVQDLEGRIELSRRQTFDTSSTMSVDTEVVAGAIALSRVGDSDITGQLIGQELAFDASGEDSAYGAFVRGGLSFTLVESARLSLDAEATWMSDAAFVGGGQATLSFGL